MRRFAIGILIGLSSIALALLTFCPAAWLGAALESQTAGRLTLGDAQGTLWQGSAFFGGAASIKDPVTPLLPGRFSWRLSPWLLVGQIELWLENPAALSQPVLLSGNLSQWQLSPGTLVLPAERLAGLGAPLNTVAPSGQMRLSWGQMQLTRRDRTIGAEGLATLEMDDIGSRLSSVKPLGAYRLIMDWRGQQAGITLTSLKGPLLLSGTGTMGGGHFQFSGQAQAAAGQEESLANLLNLLGQRRKQDDKNVIALEFRQ